MSSTKRGLTLALSGLAIVSMLTGAFFVAHVNSHAAPAAPTTGPALRYIGDSAFGPASVGAPLKDTVSQPVAPEAPAGPVHKQASVAKVQLPTPATGHGAQGATSAGFAGLDHYQNRTANSGNQFSLEPPDQGLCVGNGYVVEPVNDVLGVYTANGRHQLIAGPTALNPFLKLAPSILRTANPLVFGPFVSDPKCYYDAPTNRWFLTALEIDTNSATGAFEAGSHEYIAVSDSANPTGTWAIYTISTENPNGYPEGNAVNDCPCFGDQPLLGADANGIYISTNEFPTFNAGFHGAQIYAISKTGLERAGRTGQMPPVVHINAGVLPAPSQTVGGVTYPGGPWYSIQPAETPQGGRFDGSHGGTEYFLSSLDFNGFGDDRVATWALTNTRSLNSPAPNVALADVVINSVPYSNTPSNGAPFAATQKAGTTPLADLLTASGFGPNAEDQLNANDDRMNQVVYADGMLWSGVNTTTAINTVAVAYFIVRPSFHEGDAGALAATMVKDGYVFAPGNANNALFPSIGVNSHGQGAITFTLSGPDYYPSAAYAPIDARSGAGDVVTSAAGVGADDGFTGYAAYGGNGVGRWGDYSAAVAGPDGSIWTADEYIGQTCTDAQFNADSTCGGTRTLLANWGTFITDVRVGHGENGQGD